MTAVHDESRIPNPESLVFEAGHERPDAREIDFVDRDRLEPRPHEKRRQIEIRLEADVARDRRDHALERGADPALAAEMIEDDDLAAGAADADHLARHRDR